MKEFLDASRWDEDMVVFNHFERVWLKGVVGLDGSRAHITDCCPADAPCPRHQVVARLLARAEAAEAQVAALRDRLKILRDIASEIYRSARSMLETNSTDIDDWREDAERVRDAAMKALAFEALPPHAARKEQP